MHSDIGAVGPRLLFADGSLQHAGMQFLRREELGIWVNHHPNMGLDPALDPHQELRSEEHTSELQSLMRISYAVFCLKKTKKNDYKPQLMTPSPTIKHNT